MIFLPLWMRWRKQLKNSISKASAIYGLPAKICEGAGSDTLNTFYNILTSILKEEIMPNDFHDAIIVTLFTNKVNKANCGNYHGFLLLSILWKILVQVIPSCLISSVSEKCLPESQRGGQTRLQHCWYGLLIETSSVEMCWAAYGPLCCLHQFNQGFWYNQHTISGSFQCHLCPSCVPQELG